MTVQQWHPAQVVRDVDTSSPRWRRWMGERLAAQIRRESEPAARSAEFRMSDGTWVPFACALGMLCPARPLAEILVTYKDGHRIGTIWCEEHLPNLVRLQSSRMVRDVELRGTVFVPSRLRWV